MAPRTNVSSDSGAKGRYRTLAEFYPFYQSEKCADDRCGGAAHQRRADRSRRRRHAAHTAAKTRRPTSHPPPKTNKKTAQHRATGTRVLHVLGTGAFLLQLAAALVTRRAVFAATGVVSAYACAWVGHFFVEVCVSCLWCVCVCVLSV